jgi:hypothetical protein
MMMSLWVPRALYAAATLGIADVLADRALSSEEVARRVDADPETLRRLLRALVAINVCRVIDGGEFELTAIGECLRSEGRNSVRSWVLLMGGEMCARSWANLPECVRTGESTPQSLDGMETFEQLAMNPAEFAVFDHAMVELTRHLAGLIEMAYDFAGIDRIIDVGGGHGALLPPILKANPDMKGAVYDMAHCREGAERLFAKTKVSERCEFIAGNFFEDVPADGDAYLLKSVLHDWNDEKSNRILRNLGAAMGADGRLLIIEGIVPELPGSSPADEMMAATDLNMMVNTGGKERTEVEYRKLLGDSGLRVAGIFPTLAGMSIIEARVA